MLGIGTFAWGDARNFDPRPCQNLLISEHLLDETLVGALKRLTPEQRASRHIPEFEAKFKRLRRMIEVRNTVYRTELLGLADQLLTEKKLTYFNMWYLTLLSLSIRAIPETSIPAPENFKLVFSPIESLLNDGTALPIHAHVGIFAFVSSFPGLPFMSHVDRVFYTRNILIPVIDDVDQMAATPVALFEPGQFTASFEPGVYPVGISREDKNSIHTYRDIPAVFVALHDIAHTLLVENPILLFAEQNQMPVREIHILHDMILSGIELIEPIERARAALNAYEFLIHERGSFATILTAIVTPEALRDFKHSPIRQPISELQDFILSRLSELLSGTEGQHLSGQPLDDLAQIYAQVSQQKRYSKKFEFLRKNVNRLLRENPGRGVLIGRGSGNESGLGVGVGNENEFSSEFRIVD